MGIKQDPKSSKTYIVRHSRRHPITREPRTLTRKGIPSLAEARRVLNAMVIELDKKFKETIVPSWAKALELFIEYSRSRDLTEKTIANYLVNLRSYTATSWGDRAVDSFTQDEIRQLILSRTIGRSQSQQKNLLKFIRAGTLSGTRFGRPRSTPDFETASYTL